MVMEGCGEGFGGGYGRRPETIYIDLFFIAIAIQPVGIMAVGLKIYMRHINSLEGSVGVMDADPKQVYILFFCRDKEAMKECQVLMLNALSCGSPRAYWDAMWHTMGPSFPLSCQTLKSSIFHIQAQFDELFTPP